MMGAPVDEQLGRWNVSKKQYEEVECVAVKTTKLSILCNNSELIWSWGRRSMAMAGEVTRHNQAHPYSWSITNVSLRSKESEGMNHRSEWKPNS